MTGDDWHDHSLTTLGMFVSGAPLRSPGPRGEQQVDRRSRSSSTPATRRADGSPRERLGRVGEVVLSTNPASAGTQVKAGDQMRLGSRSVVVLRET